MNFSNEVRDGEWWKMQREGEWEKYFVYSRKANVLLKTDVVQLPSVAWKKLIQIYARSCNCTFWVASLKNGKLIYMFQEIHVKY